jgi:outer membrane protein TolC
VAAVPRPDRRGGTLLAVLVSGMPITLLLAVALASSPAPRTLRLAEALRELDAQSLTLAQARARADEAAGLSRQALAAALPILSAAGGYTRNSDRAVAPIGLLAAATLPPGAPRPANLIIQPLEAFSASATLRVPLVAPSAWAEAAAARSGAAVASASAGAARPQVRAALRQAAFAAQANEEIVAASERALASAEEQARLAAHAVEAGTGTSLAVLRARTEAVKRRSELSLARAAVERAQLALGILLGRADPVRIPLDPPARPAAIDVAALTQEALAGRGELAAASAQVEGTERQLTAARLRVLPQLSASGSVFAQDVPFPTGQKDGWRLTVDLTWTLYDGGLRYGRARQEAGAAAEARAAAEAQRLAVVQEVEDAAREVAVTAERLGLKEDQVRLAAEAAATARRGFAGGVAGSLDVLDANDRLFQSEVALAEVRAQLGAALAALERAAGRS